MRELDVSESHGNQQRFLYDTRGMKSKGLVYCVLWLVYITMKKGLHETKPENTLSLHMKIIFKETEERGESVKEFLK